jgi:two-component system, LuxR family, sensor histidine kinase DctS
MAVEVPRPRRTRWLLWAALVALLGVAQSLLVLLTLDYEASRSQERADAAAVTGAAELRRVVQRSLQSAQSLTWSNPPLPQGRFDAQDMLRQRREMLRMEWRSPSLALIEAVDTPYGGPLFQAIARRDLEIELQAACAAAARTASPAFSRSYFVPRPGGLGLEVIDLCIPLSSQTSQPGFLVATLGLTALLEEASGSSELREHELSLVEPDGTRLARTGLVRGAGVYHATRVVDLAGQSLQLRADAAAGPPRLIPNLAVALVLGLSLALFVVVVLLARDVRRRARAETALAEALAFRRAMEDSLVTGLRARDNLGRITYVNPAFCSMVGFAASELVGSNPPPYWPPEQVELYRRRQADRLNPNGDPNRQREGFETVFMRRNGERFPVMIYEAPLLDRVGHQAGWMSAVLDVSAERQMQDRSRQQQERLAATARLATVGEMASLLSHELNQPLAAIASYAAGSLNLMAAADADPDRSEAELLGLLRQAIGRIAEQAERAGRVIKSVHGFVRRREQSREAISADQLIEAVLPLVRLQARKSGAQIEVDIARPVPTVMADRTMVEQVLLNLTRNGIQAMEPDTPLAQRVLKLRVAPASGRWVQFSVADAGPGIPESVARQLFTPFFTTREEGMGLGLSLCRTVIEQHGGVLDFGPAQPASAAGAGPGTLFRFTLPVPDAARRPAGQPAEAPSALALPDPLNAPANGLEPPPP